MPSAAAMTRSSGVVMKPRTRSALAPTYTVVTVIAAFSLRGYWRTLTERMAWKPAIRITRFTTIASTGRRMKISVKDFKFAQASGGFGDASLFGTISLLIETGILLRSLKTQK